jgi:hypothetical protein
MPGSLPNRRFAREKERGEIHPQANPLPLRERVLYKIMWRNCDAEEL